VKKRKSLVFVSVILLLSLATFGIASCAPTEKATTESKVGEETTATTAETAAAAETKATAEEITVRVDCGGPEGGVFAINLYSGAKAAEAKLDGVKVEAVWSDWDPGKEIENFKATIAAKPDGAVLIGQPGDDAFGPLIDEAIGKGILVTTMCVDLPKTEAKYKAKGFGYAGADNYSAGYNLAKKAAEDYGLKEGDRAMVWGLLGEPIRGLRTKGCIDALKEKGVIVDYLDISPDVNKENSAGVPVFGGYVSSHPDVKLIITDHGGLTATAEAYMKGAGKNPGDIIIAGFDLTAATVEAIRNGYVQVVADQQPWLQGFLAVQQIYLTKLYGFSGLHIDTGAGTIDKSNVDFVAPLAEQNIR